MNPGFEPLPILGCNDNLPTFEHIFLRCLDSPAPYEVAEVCSCRLRSSLQHGAFLLADAHAENGR